MRCNEKCPKLLEDWPDFSKRDLSIYHTSTNKLLIAQRSSIFSSKLPLLCPTARLSLLTLPVMMTRYKEIKLCSTSTLNRNVKSWTLPNYRFLQLQVLVIDSHLCTSHRLRNTLETILGFMWQTWRVLIPTLGRKTLSERIYSGIVHQMHRHSVRHLYRLPQHS